MPVHTALELSSMVSWLQKFLETPDSMQVEDFMIVTGSETKAMITRGKSIKYVLLTLWVSFINYSTCMPFQLTENRFNFFLFFFSFSIIHQLDQLCLNSINA